MNTYETTSREALHRKVDAFIELEIPFTVVGFVVAVPPLPYDPYDAQRTGWEFTIAEATS